MTESPVTSIEIINEIPFFGEGDTLESRLRKVSLRGFGEVKIYGEANFEDIYLSKQQILQKIHTPQPTVYQKNLDRISTLAELFRKKGINILNLEKAYDYLATHIDGQQTQWTMLPPIIERFHIPKNVDGKFDYNQLIGDELRKALEKEGLGLNPELQLLQYTSQTGFFDLINDGSHRIHHGYLNGGIRVLRIVGMKKGYPYYAAPQPYSTVHVAPEANEQTTSTKIHIVTSPGQKLLYRLFPSGGIMSGTVRIATAKEKFV